MPIIEIKHWNGNVLHTIEADNIKAAVEALVRAGADLRGAYLRGAYLRGAYLGGADLRGAYLRGAYLRGAVLGEAKYYNDVPLTKIPVFISGLDWEVIILDTHLKIGCELRLFTEWESDGDKIAANHDQTAWWKQHKEAIFALIKACK